MGSKINDDYVGGIDEEYTMFTDDSENEGESNADNADNADNPTSETGEENAEPNEEENATGDEKELSETEKAIAEEKKKYDNLRSLQARQAAELGTLRALVAELQSSQKPVEPIDKSQFMDKFIENPQEALAAELERRQQETNKRATAEQLRARQNVEAVYEKIPDFDEVKDIIIKLAKEEDGIEGANLEMLNVTVQNDPALAIQYARRAQLYKMLQERDNVTKKTLKNVANRTQRSPTVTGSSGSVSNSTGKLTHKDVINMSDAELAEKLKALTR